MAQPAGYFADTRHPWPCLLFLVPLLALYESGVQALGGASPETLRNGADYYLRYSLQSLGVSFGWVPPAVLVLGFAVWSWRRGGDRPADLPGVLSGMVLESVTYALGLWAVSRVLAPVLSHLGVELAVPALPCQVGDPMLRQTVTYVGAGVYEEAVFRLVLFSALVRVGQFCELPRGVALFLGALGSAVLFSAAHHVGPYGQPYGNYLFLFRLVAGLYFAMLYQFRGFGIAVGAHACYNVMVSVT